MENQNASPRESTRAHLAEINERIQRLEEESRICRQKIFFSIASYISW
jgi:hypothetical protein